LIEDKVMADPLSRREFVQIGAATVAAAVLPSLAVSALAADPPIRLKKAVKFGMIGIDGSVEDKFKLIKELGFEGVEMDAPGGPDYAESVAASQKTGIKIHGVVDSIHWKIRLSDPDEAVRDQGYEGLVTAIKACKAYGGTTALLVPGKVSNPKTESYDQVWERSAALVRKAMPVAKEAGVKIGIETVWNEFITKPEEFAGYIDQFHDDTVGGYFDISNMIKYGPSPARWIRVLGKRLLKVDFKGYSHEKQWVKIGEGDENWPDVLQALADVDYKGEFITAEVGGGGRDVLADISQRMDKILGLS
jgi:hexulose-6-phosphate isomerase